MCATERPRKSFGIHNVAVGICTLSIGSVRLEERQYNLVTLPVVMGETRCWVTTLSARRRWVGCLVLSNMM